MPDPNESNRDRLLRLIDGGQDSLKEVQEERGAKSVEETPATAKKPEITWRSKLIGRDKDLVRLVKLLGIFVLLLICLHFASNAWKSMKNNPSPSAQASGDLALDESSEIGLRLVGVDSSDPPVALLEDLKTGKTYFARLNDRVLGARVKKIEKNKVTVSVRGKSVELR